MNKNIVIEGVVGVGKSSLMNELSNKFGIAAFAEPVVDNPLLDKFYHDKKRYSFALQVFFMNRRIELINESAQEDGSVLDRSIYGDLLFSKILYEDGNMSKEELDLYQSLLDNMASDLKSPDLLVYLRIKTDNAVKRIKKRGRDYEQMVDYEYWERLNKEYDKFFLNYKKSPIIVIDVDSLDFVEKESDRKYVLSLIEKKLKEI